MEWHIIVSTYTMFVIQKDLPAEHIAWPAFSYELSPLHVSNTDQVITISIKPLDHYYHALNHSHPAARAFVILLQQNPFQIRLK